jgi:hypothetical protein
MVAGVTALPIADIDQPDAQETVRFGVDGQAYEIDLPASRASELRTMAGRYIGAARRVRSAPSRARRQPRTHPRGGMDPEQSRRIRSWALERGLLASPRGRIPPHVVAEYQTATRAAPVPASPPDTEPAPAPSARAERQSAGRGGSPGAAQDEPATTQSLPGTAADITGGEHGLTDREKQELCTIADAAKPRGNIVAARLRTKGLTDRDSAGNWWLTDAGRRELTSR